MSTHSPSIERLIDEFNKLPGIGPKTAEKFVFYLLSQPKAELEKLGQAVEHLKDKIQICSSCQNYSESDPCPICNTRSRDHQTICVVAESPDVLAIEKTGEYTGVYHILGGVINAVEGISPKDLKIKQLTDRLDKDGIKEIIIALDPTIEGESTVLYLIKLLSKYKVKVTRLAQGLPTGSSIEYADEITLTNALKGRLPV